MKTIITYTALALAVLVIASPAVGSTMPIHNTKTNATATAVVHARNAVAWQRSSTYHWQDVSGVRRTPTKYAERHTKSVAYIHWMVQLWKGRHLHAKQHMMGILAKSDPASAQRIIKYVFKGNGSFALTISYRESRYTVGAANGQYLGLFQMGTGERATYATIGYSTAYEQTVAAHNLFLARGWEPWTCCE